MLHGMSSATVGKHLNSVLWNCMRQSFKQAHPTKGMQLKFITQHHNLEMCAFQIIREFNHLCCNLQFLLQSVWNKTLFVSTANHVEDKGTCETYQCTGFRGLESLSGTFKATKEHYQGAVPFTRYLRFVHRTWPSSAVLECLALIPREPSRKY